MAKTADMKMTIELSEYDRVLIRQLIDRLANPVAPVLPNPYPQITPWWQSPVISNGTEIREC